MNDPFPSGLSGPSGFGGAPSSFFDVQSTSLPLSASPVGKGAAVPIGLDVDKVGARGSEVLQDATRHQLGYRHTAQIKRKAAEEIKTYVVERLRSDCQAALDISRANASTAVTEHLEELALWRAERTNERRLALDAKLAAVGQGALDQSFRQIDVTFVKLEAEEEMIMARYPEGHPRRAMRLEGVQEQAFKLVETIKTSVSLIMDKSCHEFQEALRIR